MFTFFAITTIVNLALGYGLAVFLMRSRQNHSDTELPMQMAELTSETMAAAPPAPVEIKSVSSSVPTATSKKPEVSVPELSELVSPMHSTQPQPENSKSSNQQSTFSDPILRTVPSEGHVDSLKVSKETDNSPTDSTESNIPEFEPETTPITSDDSCAQPPSEEDLLAGIAAFRAQLSAENPSAESNTSSEEDAGTPPAGVPE